MSFNDAVECVYPWRVVLAPLWVFQDDDIMIFANFRYEEESDDTYYYEDLTIVDSDFRIHSLPKAFKVYSRGYSFGNIIRDTDGTFWHCYCTSNRSVTVVGFTFKENYSDINITYRHVIVPTSTNLVSGADEGRLRKFGNRLFIGAYNEKALIHDIGSNTFAETDAYNIAERTNNSELFVGPDSSGTVYELYRNAGVTSGGWTSVTFYKVGRYNILSGGISQPGLELSVNAYGYDLGSACSITDDNGDIYFVVRYGRGTSSINPIKYYITVIKISNGVITKKDIDDPSPNDNNYLSIAVDSNRLYILLYGIILIMDKNLDVQETVVMDDSRYKVTTSLDSSDIINGKILYKTCLIDTSTFEITKIGDSPMYILEKTTTSYSTDFKSFSHNGAAIIPLFTYDSSSVADRRVQYGLAFPNERQVRGVSIE